MWPQSQVAPTTPARFADMPILRLFERDRGSGMVWESGVGWLMALIGARD